MPWAPDQEFLKENESSFISFLNSGGIIVSLGEFDLQWLPQTVWEPGLFNEIHIMDKNNLIFKNLNDNDLSGWGDSAHGYFRKVPKNALLLATTKKDENDLIIAYVDTSNFNGSILAMTLDPDFHTYQGIEGAKDLLRNIIVSWAMNQRERIKEKGNFKKGISRREITVYLTSKYFLKFLFSIIVTILIFVISSIIISEVSSFPMDH